MQSIPDASPQSLIGFIQQSLEESALVHTDGWPGYPSDGNFRTTHCAVFLVIPGKTFWQSLPNLLLINERFPGMD